MDTPNICQKEAMDGRFPNVSNFLFLGVLFVVPKNEIPVHIAASFSSVIFFVGPRRRTPDLTKRAWGNTTHAEVIWQHVCVVVLWAQQIISPEGSPRYTTFKAYSELTV